MKTMKYFLGILIFLMGTSFSAHKNTTITVNPLIQGFFDTWLGDYTASVFLKIRNDQIVSIEIEEDCDCKPLIGIFNFENINKEVDTLDYHLFNENKIIFSQAKKSTLEKVNNLLKIHISPNFSTKIGGEIAISYRLKKEWETMKVFVLRQDNNFFSLYKEKNVVDTLKVNFNWRFRIVDVELK